MTQENTPNTDSAVPVQPSVQDLDNEILSIMTSMTSSNPTPDASPTDTGSTDESEAVAPVVPDDTLEPEDSSAQPEVAEETEEEPAPEEVSDSQTEDLIDFIELAKETPDLKFKFMRDGKEMIVDAKKAASILGQGAAVSESARELKVQKAEFEEYEKERKAHLEGLTLAMEFTIQPQLQRAYDGMQDIQDKIAQNERYLATISDPAEIAQVRGYQQVFKEQMRELSGVVEQMKPKVDQFQSMRKQQVADILESNRKQFKDKELKNAYVYNEIREKVAKDWAGANSQLVPGIDNIDLVSSDEHIMSLLRDGLKYRDKPSARATGGSTVAALARRPATQSTSNQASQYNRLREAAKKGNRQAQDDLILATINAQLADGKSKR